MGGPTTVFVRNLPYTVTDARLEEAFSEIGPVKECFIIADKGAGGQSKGFGFVHFALAEDAAAAVTRTREFQIDGRPVTIDIAKQKPSSKGTGDGTGPREGGGGGGGGEGAVAGAGAGAGAEDGGGGDGDDSDSDAPRASSAPAAHEKVAPREPQQRPQHKPRGALAGAAAVSTIPGFDTDRAARTVAVGGLKLAGEPDGIEPEAAMAAARAAGSVEEVVSPAPVDVVGAAKLRHDGCTRGVALVVYQTAEAGPTHISHARRVVQCHLTHGTRVRNVLDDVASGRCEALH
jgi:nucleolar protein 4